MKIIRLKDPILTPSNELEWMTKTVMNPGVAVYDGKLRMVFTAGNKKGNYYFSTVETSEIIKRHLIFEQVCSNITCLF